MQLRRAKDTFFGIDGKKGDAYCCLEGGLFHQEIGWSRELERSGKLIKTFFLSGYGYLEMKKGIFGARSLLKNMVWLPNGNPKRIEVPMM